MMNPHAPSLPSMGTGAVVGIFAALLVVLALPASAAASNCSFRLGFQALHERIPPIVGACLDEEAHNPANGDALQHTTGGLLVWRKADNYTAFTDGARTWIAGPYGVQRRANDQLFAWEVAPGAGAGVLPLVTSPSSVLFAGVPAYEQLYASSCEAAAAAVALRAYGYAITERDVLAHLPVDTERPVFGGGGRHNPVG